MMKFEEMLKDHEKRILALEGLIKNESKPTIKQISSNEFLLEKKPQDDVQKTLILGYYLEKYREINYFNKTDLEKAFRETKEKIPININECVNKNIKKGHMMEYGEKKDGLKSWILTNGGERFVENGFRDKREV